MSIITNKPILFKLNFNTGQTYENAWHEIDWDIDYGYFSTREKAEEYIESIFMVFVALDEQRKYILSKLELVRAAYMRIEDAEERMQFYETHMVPISISIEQTKVKGEFRERKFYIITEITKDDIDKPMQSQPSFFTSQRPVVL